MTNNSLAHDSSVAAFSGIRASLSRFLDFLAETSQAMRCAREAERLARLPDADLLRLGVKRDEIIQHAFRGYLGH